MTTFSETLNKSKTYIYCGALMVTLTEKAGKKLEELIQEEKKNNRVPDKSYGLRIEIFPNCCGFQYMLGFDSNGAKGEYKVFKSQGIEMYVKEIDAPFMKDAQIDYEDDNDEFKIYNPNEKSNCAGCDKECK